MEITLFVTIAYLIICSLVIRKVAKLPDHVPPLTAEVAYVILGFMLPFILVAMFFDMMLGNFKKPGDE